MSFPRETNLNNPCHPCQFCAQLIPQNQTFCSRECTLAHEAHQLLANDAQFPVILHPPSSILAPTD